MLLENIKLVISEIDGIITEGLVGFGEMNIPMFKQFFIKDFEAINEIKKHWGFVFISSDPSNKNIGSIMKFLKENYAGKYDGQEASKIAKERIV